MMSKSKSYNKHPTHKALFDAFALSLSMDEDDTDRVIDEPPSQKKRHRDDQDHDPSSDLSKKKKKRKESVEDDVVDAENPSKPAYVRRCN
ncbi:hypothetical protein Tco_0288569, partial [Tanacetum coccineum]